MSRNPTVSFKRKIHLVIEQLETTRPRTEKFESFEETIRKDGEHTAINRCINILKSLK